MVTLKASVCVAVNGSASADDVSTPEDRKMRLTTGLDMSSPKQNHLLLRDPKAFSVTWIMAKA
jgi:hypothetical protein